MLTVEDRNILCRAKRPSERSGRVGNRLARLLIQNCVCEIVVATTNPTKECYSRAIRRDQDHLQIRVEGMLNVELHIDILDHEIIRDVNCRHGRPRGVGIARRDLQRQVGRRVSHRRQLRPILEQLHYGQSASRRPASENTLPSASPRLLSQLIEPPS